MNHMEFWDCNFHAENNTMILKYPTFILTADTTDEIQGPMSSRPHTCTTLANFSVTFVKLAPPVLEPATTWVKKPHPTLPFTPANTNTLPLSPSIEPRDALDDYVGLPKMGRVTQKNGSGIVIVLTLSLLLSRLQVFHIHLLHNPIDAL